MVRTELRGFRFTTVSTRWRLLGAAALVGSGLFASPAGAQSAADKATARELATEGIRLYREKSYAEALEKLNRAEALYDAPPHLLYIARSYVALGQLVEGAEAYRRLVRAELPAGSPAAFAAAVEEGTKELAELEPRLSSLKVEVTPADAVRLSVSVDGKELNVAALGAKRPTNPGRHVVEASAEGYVPARQEVELAEGKEDAVTLTLTVDPHPPNLASSAATTPGDGGVSGGSGEKNLGDMGFTAALRIGGFTRFGSGGQLASGEDAGDYFPGGIGGELDAGFRFKRYFQAKIFGQVFGLAKGDAIEAASSATPRGSEVTSEARGQGGGIAVSGGTDPSKLGIFGEIALLSQQYVLTQKLVQVDDTSCEGTTTYSGGAVRLGVGGYIPLGSSFNLTPLLAFTMGSISSIESEGDLDSAGGAPSCGQTKTRTQEGSFGNHEVFLGVGGEFMFGDQWFR